MGFIDKNIRDLSKLIKIFIFNTIIYSFLVVYFKTEISIESYKVSKILNERNAILNTDFLVNNELAGSVADKALILFFIVLAVALFTSIYNALTYDRFSWGFVATITNAILATITIYIPINLSGYDFALSGNHLLFGNFILMILLTMLFATIMTYLILRLLGKCIDFLIFGRKLKYMHMVSLKDNHIFDNENGNGDTEETMEEFDYENYYDMDGEEKSKGKKGIKSKISKYFGLSSKDEDEFGYEDYDDYEDYHNYEEDAFTRAIPRVDNANSVRTLSDYEDHTYDTIVMANKKNKRSESGRVSIKNPTPIRPKN